MPVVVIDTREQTPLCFERLASQRGTLDAGDYSIVGLEHLVALERKNLGDLLGCCGYGRDRFKRELQRLRAYRYRLLLVEADAKTLETGIESSTLRPWRSKLQPSHVLGALAAWIAQYDLPTWLAGDHAAAGRFAERYLYQCARRVAMENKSVACVATDQTHAAATVS